MFFYAKVFKIINMPLSISIQKKNRSPENYQPNKLAQTFHRILKDKINLIDQNLLISEIEKQLFPNISTHQINEVLILTATSWIEKDPIYGDLATGLLLQKLYREVFPHRVSANNFSEIYRQSFINHLRMAVQTENADPRLLEFDLVQLSQVLVPERDNLFNYLGLETLYGRYFWRKDQQILETPQAFWMRVAMGLALQEKAKEQKAIEFYQVMSTFRFIPSTPTLFHSGLKEAQLSSCFLTTVEGEFGTVFKTYGDTVKLLLYSGGVSNDWTNFKTVGSPVKNISARGLISALKTMNSAVCFANDLSEKRRGAVVAYLEVWHWEVEEFCDLRKNVGDERRRTHELNLAVWIPDLFMKRAREEKAWTLFSPNEVADLHHLYGKDFEQRYEYYEQQVPAGKIKLFKQVSAKTLWQKILIQLFETGYPWITFKDACNIRSPQNHVGVVHCSNLCTEITLNTSQAETAVCNLGSVNLSKHITKAKLEEELFQKTILTAMRMLDNVIDLNYYPTAETKNSNLKHRPVGLGMMGFQDALFQSNIPYNSPQALKFTNEITEKYSYYAILGSCQLAQERGTYSSYKGSKWDRGIFPLDTLNLLEKERGEKIAVAREEKMNWNNLRQQVRQFGMRNSNTMAIAPTATISNIAGCYSCIEAMYSNLYVESNIAGEFVIVNKYLVADLKKLNLWNQNTLDQIKYHNGSIQNLPHVSPELKEKYRGVFELDSLWMIKIAAQRSKWIDQSISHNVFYQGTSGKELSKIYFTAWNLGLKTTYYLRTLGASQIEKSTLDASKFSYTQKRDSSRPACSLDSDCESCQ